LFKFICIKYIGLYPNFYEIQKERLKNNETSFVYKKDLDGFGICYWLGYNNYTKEWINPVKLGLINITCSKWNKNMRDKPEAIIELQPAECYTTREENSWIMFDFKDYYIRPTAYSITHWSIDDDLALRNWRFEGSNDGKTWNILKKHENDKALKTKGIYLYFRKNK